MERFNIDENIPIDMPIISSSIESAQRKVESVNFSIRKNVLEYDDVMNKQREIIYSQRNKVLDGDDIKESVRKMIHGTVEDTVLTYASAKLSPDEWDFEAMHKELDGWLTVSSDFRYSVEQLNKLEPEDILKNLIARADSLYDTKERKYGAELMREAERVILLNTVDSHWMDHIDAMDELRNGIGLRAYGQHDPVLEYRNEGYDMFNAMSDSIRTTTAKRLMSLQIREEQREMKRTKVAEESGTGEKTNTTVRGKGVVSKNALCPCGSGKKYKRCCGKDID
jgi:preprotein translocase subunit SecA